MSRSLFLTLILLSMVQPPFHRGTNEPNRLGSAVDLKFSLSCGKKSTAEETEECASLSPLRRSSLLKLFEDVPLQDVWCLQYEQTTTIQSVQPSDVP